MVVLQLTPRNPLIRKTETFVTIGDMTYVREVTETDFYNCMCLNFQFDPICVFSDFVLTSKPLI